MIAMPVKSRSENPAISPVFGKVKYFAVVDDNGAVEFIENIDKSGVKAVELLLSRGVKTLLMAHIGDRPFQFAKSSGIGVYYVGNERVTVNEAVEKFKNGQLPDASTLDPSLFNSHGGGHHH
jgi:predicted Fe-Mo cluster-binding NifX family protein